VNYSERLTIKFEREDGDGFTTHESETGAESFHEAFPAVFTILNAAYGQGPEATLKWIEEWVTEYRAEWFEPYGCDPSYAAEIPEAVEVVSQNGRDCMDGRR
jgi:hypothetical protein